MNRAPRYKPPRPTLRSVYDSLVYLTSKMDAVATQMRECRPPSEELRLHASELASAATLVNEWAADILTILSSRKKPRK